MAEEKLDKQPEQKPKPFYNRGYKTYLIIMTVLVLIAAAVLAVMYLSVYMSLDRQISG